MGNGWIIRHGLGNTRDLSEMLGIFRKFLKCFKWPRFQNLIGRKQKLSRALLGSLSKHDVDESKNVIRKFV